MFSGLAGVVIAFIEKALYDSGVGVNALSRMSISLTELMTVTIILWLLLGCIIGVLKS